MQIAARRMASLPALAGQHHWLDQDVGEQHRAGVRVTVTKGCTSPRPTNQPSTCRGPARCRTAATASDDDGGAASAEIHQVTAGGQGAQHEHADEQADRRNAAGRTGSCGFRVGCATTRSRSGRQRDHRGGLHREASATGRCRRDAAVQHKNHADGHRRSSAVCARRRSVHDSSGLAPTATARWRSCRRACRTAAAAPTHSMAKPMPHQRIRSTPLRGCQAVAGDGDDALGQQHEQRAVGRGRVLPDDADVVGERAGQGRRADARRGRSRASARSPCAR